MKLAVGAEIDAWCTSCRLDLGHRIVAMVEGAPKRVICLTCNKTHNYRRPQNAPAAAVSPAAVAGRTASASGGSSSKAKATPTKAASGASKAAGARAAAMNLKEWEARMAEGSGALLTYSIEKRFSPGQHIVHRKFGAGFVQEVLDEQKVTVLFREGAKTLIHNQVAAEPAA